MNKQEVVPLTAILLLCGFLVFASIQYRNLRDTSPVKVGLPAHSDVQMGEILAMNRLSQEIRKSQANTFVLDWIGGALSGRFYRLVYDRQQARLSYDSAGSYSSYEPIYIFGKVNDAAIHSVARMPSGGVLYLPLYGCTKWEAWKFDKKHRGRGRDAQKSRSWPIISETFSPQSS